MRGGRAVPFVAAILAARLLTAAQAQPPGAVRELLELRTITSKTWLGADDSRTAEVFSGPIHFRDVDGSWQEIDTTLTAAERDGYIRSSAKNWFKCHFAGDASGWQAIELNGRLFELRADPPSWSPAILGGSLIAYPDAWPGVDLCYRATPVGIKEELVLRRKPVVPAFRFVVRAPDLTAVADATTGMEFWDAEGRPVIRMLAPFMHDAAGQHSRAIRVAWGTGPRGTIVIALEPDPRWLARAIYPVVIDPPWNPVFTPSLDKYAVETLSDPRTVTWYEGTTKLYLGRDEVSSPHVIQHACVQFNTTSIPTCAYITAAKIDLVDTGESASGKTVSMKRITGDWPADDTPPTGETVVTRT